MLINFFNTFEKDKFIMEDFINSVKLNPVPIHNIVKSNLVQHSNEKLCPRIIEELSIQITETIECFLNKHLKELEKL